MPDLKVWIEEQLKRGYAKNDSKEYLLRKGYTQSAVAQLDKINFPNPFIGKKVFSKLSALPGLVVFLSWRMNALSSLSTKNARINQKAILYSAVFIFISIAIFLVYSQNVEAFHFYPTPYGYPTPAYGYPTPYPTPYGYPTPAYGYPYPYPTPYGYPTPAYGYPTPYPTPYGYPTPAYGYPTPYPTPYGYPTPAYGYPTPYPTPYGTPYGYPTPAYLTPAYLTPAYLTPAAPTCSSTGCTQCLAPDGACETCLSTDPVCFSTETDCGCPAPPPTCTPDCLGKVCGDDGCGGSCGTCSDTTGSCPDGSTRSCSNFCFDGSCSVCSLPSCPLPPTQCSDGLDNDANGCTDLVDPGCSDAADNDESGGCPVATPICSSGSCFECTDNSHCGTGEFCQSNICVVKTCTNQPFGPCDTDMAFENKCGNNDPEASVAIVQMNAGADFIRVANALNASQTLTVRILVQLLE